jgi:hypothetical protein
MMLTVAFVAAEASKPWHHQVVDMLTYERGCNSDGMRQPICTEFESATMSTTAELQRLLMLQRTRLLQAVCGGASNPVVASAAASPQRRYLHSILRATHGH